jgi:ferredoxin
VRHRGERGAAGVEVRLLRSGRSFAGDWRGTLLEQAEAAGARPAFGCRMGACGTCRCRKRSGIVQDVRTGAISAEPDEDIRLCVSVFGSDVELCL